MPYIVSYQKFIDIDRTVEIALPADLEGQRIGVELATIDGVTYVSLPDEVTLPGQQPAEVGGQYCQSRHGDVRAAGAAQRYQSALEAYLAADD